MGGMSGNRSDLVQAELRRRVGRSLRALGSDLDRLDEAVAARFGLHRTDLRCLEIVGRDGPMPAGRLAEQAGLSTSAVTSVIDRVQRLGMLRRTSDPADRRKVLVELTEQGREHGRAAFAGLMQGTDRLLSAYGPKELERIGQFLEQVRALVAAEARAAGAASSTASEEAAGERRTRRRP